MEVLQQCHRSISSIRWYRNYRRMSATTNLWNAKL